MLKRSLERMLERSLERMFGKIQHYSIVDSVGETVLKFSNHSMVRYIRKGMRDRYPTYPSIAAQCSLEMAPHPFLVLEDLLEPLTAILDIHSDTSLTDWGSYSSDARHVSSLWSSIVTHFHIKFGAGDCHPHDQKTPSLKGLYRSHSRQHHNSCTMS